MKYIFMTGATSGLGKAAAMKLAADGAVILALSRDARKGEILLNDLAEEYPERKGEIKLISGDLSSLGSVAKACELVKREVPRLDMIINNAGIMNFERKETQDGIEETWQVNLLAPALITHLLIDKMKTAKEPKLIYTTSGLHRGVIDFVDPEFSKKKFVSYKCYAQSKLGIILMTRRLAQELSEESIGVYTQHPGLVNTELGRSAGWLSRVIFRWMGASPEQGAETLLYLAETPSADLVSGEYYTKSHVARITDESYDMHMAEKLMALMKKYLEIFITGPSPVFP